MARVLSFMRRALKISVVLVAILFALLLANSLALTGATRDAELNVDGAELIDTSSGTLQVLDEGNPQGSPIVLLHCFSCSMHWFDRLAPLLGADHRVIRVELLGHGGSEKPRSGYEITDQSAAVAEALSQMGVSNATVVGHSLGGAVAVDLASRSPELATGVLTIGTAPEADLAELSALARLGARPLIGPALKRITDIAPSSMVQDQIEQAFAPGFNLAEGFENPDQVVDDLRSVTYSAFHDARQAFDDYVNESSLAVRLAESGTPAVAIFGSEDQIVEDQQAAVAAYADAPNVETVILDGIGHSANVEAPEAVAPLILKLADEAARQADAERQAEARRRKAEAVQRAERKAKRAAQRRKAAGSRAAGDKSPAAAGTKTGK